MSYFVGRTRWCPEVNAYVGEIPLGDLIWEVRIRKDDYAGPDGLTVLATVSGDILSRSIGNNEGELGISYAAPLVQPDRWDGEKRT